MSAPNRADLEEAARSFFVELTKEVDQPRQLDMANLDYAIAWNVEASREMIRELERQLVTNEFDGGVQKLASSLLRSVGVSMTEAGTQAQVVAQQLAARALREQQLYFIHQITTPTQPFTHDDKAFDAPALAPPPVARNATQLGPPAAVDEVLPLSVAARRYLTMKISRRLGESQITETKRLLDWLQQELGEDGSVHEIRRDQLRQFRDDLKRVNRRLQGRASAFRDRLTNDPASQLSSATTKKYWNYATAFFAWCEDEGYAASNPASGLRLEAKKGEESRTPPPFSNDEVLAFCNSPLFSGYKSRDRLKESGTKRIRGGHWWAGVIMMHTGLRAGELSQLLGCDFVLDVEIPHLKVRTKDSDGNTRKSVKNAASIRDVPLHQTLITLGLKEFIDARREKYRDGRVFVEFRMGRGARHADGMTRFWGDYLRTFGLWKPGRATHVWRHTVADNLRANDVDDADIGAFFGHSAPTITARYGSREHLPRKLKTINTLDYGFDVVAALGGPFDPKKHSSGGPL